MRAREVIALDPGVHRAYSQRVARARLSSLVASISGSVGGAVFHRDRSGTRIIDRVGPIQRASAAAQTAREEFSSSSAALSRLTDEQVSAWRRVAKRAGVSVRALWFRARRWRALVSDIGQWFGISLFETSRQWLGVCYDKGMSAIWAVNYDDYAYAAFTQDGYNWFLDDTIPASALRSVAINPNWPLLIACGAASGSYVIRNPYYLGWESVPSRPQGPWTCIIYRGGTQGFIMVGPRLTENIATTHDGLTWNTYTPIANALWYAVAARGTFGRVIVVGYSPSGKAAYSDGWSTWHGLSIPLTGTPQSIAVAPALNFWIICGSETDGRIAYSLGGSTWTALEIAPGFNARVVTWLPVRSMFVVAGTGTGDNLAYSYDGLNWQTTKVAEDAHPGCACEFPAIGEVIIGMRSGTPDFVMPGPTWLPTDEDGAPAVFDNQDRSWSDNLEPPSTELAMPVVENWSWILDPGDSPQSFHVHIAELNTTEFASPFPYDITGASLTWAVLWIGGPVQPARKSYTGTWVKVGSFPISNGPWDTEILTAPETHPLANGKAYNVRVQFVASGMRTSPMLATQATFETA